MPWWWPGWGWGRGSGWRWGFWITGLPGWIRWQYFAPPYYDFPYPYPPASPEEELEMLEEMRKDLEAELEDIKKRIEEIKRELGK